MADNVAITAGSGTTIAADDIGSGVLAQRVKPVHGVDGTGTDVSTTNPLPAAAFSPLKIVTASAVTRPANVTAYTANDAVSDTATAGSVTPITFTIADINDMPLMLLRCRLNTTDTGMAGKSFRIWFFRTNPTSSSGITGGDNAAFSVKKTSDFLGSMVGTFYTFSDGAVAICTPADGSAILTLPTSGAQTVFALLQTLEAFTPSANSTTITPTLEAIQARAA